MAWIKEDDTENLIGWEHSEKTTSVFVFRTNGWNVDAIRKDKIVFHKSNLSKSRALSLASKWRRAHPKG